MVVDIVKEWLNDNQDEVRNILDTHIKDNVVDTFKAVINDMTYSTFTSFKFSLQNDLQQLYQNNGIQQY